MGAKKRTIQGERYRACVFIVEETDERGVPRKLTLMRPEESVDVREHDTFITGFLREDVVEPTAN